jgi:hypothetical protein
MYTFAGGGTGALSSVAASLAAEFILTEMAAQALVARTTVATVATRTLFLLILDTFRRLILSSPPVV